MTTQTRFSSLFCTAAMGLALTIPATAVADSKTMHGSGCSPQQEFQTFIRGTEVGIRALDSIARNYFCSIVREKTNNAPILRLQARVYRPANTSNFTCRFQSRRPNGVLVQEKTRTTTQAGINTLGIQNLQTVAKGTVVLLCTLPLDGRIVSAFWNE